MKNYIVIRSHYGDKNYSIGSERKARPSDVAHLLGTCLAEPGTPEAKAAIAYKKKVEAKKNAPAKKKAPAPKKQNPSTAKKGSGSGRRNSPATKKPLTRAQKDRANQKARERRAANKNKAKA